MAKKTIKQQERGQKKEPPAWELACERIEKGALGYLLGYVSVSAKEPLAPDSWAYVTSGGTIHVNSRQEA